MNHRRHSGRRLFPDARATSRQQVDLTLKELRESLRDRRTIITLLLMPVLSYPLLGMGFRFLAVQQSARESPEYRLAVATEEEARWLSSALNTAEQHLDEPSARGSAAKRAVVRFVVPDEPAAFDVRQVVAQSAAELGLRVQIDRRSVIAGLPAAEVEIFQRAGSDLSRAAAVHVERRLQALNTLATLRWARTVDPTFRLPVREQRRLVESTGASSAIFGLLPLILLLMTVTGGVYPAIDLTAGERERNTLETLMAMPVPRIRLLLAKFVAVVTVTLLTGLMNLGAMTATVFALGLESTLFGDAGLTVSLAAKLFLVLTVFALFYSALLLMLTASARSFKEAQAYLIPLLLISLAPGLVILLPGWNLDRGTAVLPLVNMLLLARELFEGTTAWLPAIMATVSTLLYAFAALAIAARVFGSDAFVVGSRDRWRDLLQRPERASAAPSFATVLITLALLFPAYFLASGLLGRAAGIAVSLRLLLSALLTILLFAVLPLALLSWQQVRMRSGLRLGQVPVRTWIGAALLGLGTWPWVFELIVWLQSAGIGGIDETKREQVEMLLSAWQDLPVIAVIVCLGVIPGICEELFFRGFLFAGVRSQLSGWATIALTGVAFGFFHIVLAGGAAPERFVPSTVMGLLLGWVAWRSASTLPAVLLHVIHNSTLLFIVHARDELSAWSIGGLEGSHLPNSWLVGASILIVAGLLLVWWGPSRHRDPKTARNARAALDRDQAAVAAVQKDADRQA